MSTSMENTAAGPAEQLPPAVLRRPLQRCPTCRSWQLRPVVDAEAGRVHFLCGNCSRCWHVELGYVQRVHPDHCEGCPQPPRCAAVYAADHTPG